MIGSRAWFALMRRNFVYLRRNWLGTILDLILPIAFIGILVAIKNATESSSDGQLQPATYPAFAFTPLSFRDYVTAMEMNRVCVKGINTQPELQISGIGDSGFNWQVPFVKCDSRNCEQAGQNASAFCEFAMVAVSPSSTSDLGGMARAESFRNWMYETYPSLKTVVNFDFVQIFADPNEMDDYVRNANYGDSDKPKIGMGIVWNGNATNQYIYSIRQNSTNFNAPEAEGRPATQTTPDTSRLFEAYTKNDTDSCVPLDGTPEQGPFQTSCTGQYMYNGVLTFQRLVGDFIIADSGAKDAGYTVAESGVQYVPFPTFPFTTAGFFESAADYIPLLVTLGLIEPFANMVRYITREKELRQKELMKMMSVSESDIGWSWFVTFMISGFITASACAGVSGQLYTNSDGIFLWIFWLFTYMSIVVFAMLIATFTSKSTRAVVIGLLIFFIGSFLTQAVDVQTGDPSLIALVSLHPVAAFSYGLQEIGLLEDNGIGVTSSSASQTDAPSGYTFGDAIRSLIFDSVFWGVVTWYLNRVLRPDYGQALSPLFPFTVGYWCPSRVKKVQAEEEEHADDNQGVALEPVSDALRRQTAEGQSIEICRLGKKFGDKAAVDQLSLSIYSGQITALLGHNGAGKTTTIAMLTGALAPTSGYATIAGKDIRTQMQGIRQDIGICLQHDCLFPLLTVREHVQFFSRLKGLYSQMSREEAEQHIDQAIQDVALSEKRNTLSGNLSGGMKRKLSVAIAFCGGSKVVLLDEPTSGMDPFSRRFTWNVIRQYRQDRCIILTTHFMDEADILGDRIAIMSEGQLRCAGSSLFLKKTYGVGYQLTIEKFQKRGNETSVQIESNAHENDDNLKAIVHDAVPQATLLNNVGSEMSFQLPMGAAGKFGPMFDGLDSQVEEKRISSYGVSITTLDEVFLLVARGETGHHSEFASSRIDLASSKKIAEDGDRSARSRMDLEKEGLFTRHLGALFRKRAAIFKRDKRAWMFSTILPSVFVLAGFLIFKFAAPTRNLAPVNLTLNDYNVDVTAQVRNPISFNNAPSEFTCQPGVCTYQQTEFTDPGTNETMYFCGKQASLNSVQQCSINDSNELVDGLRNSGATPEGVDVSNVLNASLSLYATSKDFAATQYGAIFYTHDIGSITSDGTLYNESVIDLCNTRTNFSSDCDNFGGIGYVLQYNFTALHISPLLQNLADEALVRAAIGSENFVIQSTIEPLPITLVEQSLGDAEDAFSAWFLVVLSFPFIAGSFASFVVAERETKAKHLQTVAGVKPLAYWMSTYLWDVLNYQIPLWIVVALMFIFDVNVLTTSDRGVFSGILVSLILYGPAMAGFTYCLTFAFTSPSLCNVFVIIFGFLIGMGGPLACFILILIGEDRSNPKPNLVHAADIVSWFLRFIPSFNLGRSLFYCINIEIFDYLEGGKVQAWSESILLIENIFLAWQSVVYVCLAALIDIMSTNPKVMSVWRRYVGYLTCRCFKSKRETDEDITTALPDDDDVIAEQERVVAGEANEDLIVVSNLTKVYDNGKIAVNNMSLGIPPGECFGLLGINGAGKTTTMGVLTAEFPPTSGDATLAGYSVTRQPEKTRRRIGYCPQFDAHFANMTGREHVELYASIKGVPKRFVKEAAAAKLREVGLSDADADRLSAGYSGGMKRRLSLACAMIGQPQIVFLDECSTGVDPVARREIWQLISDMVTGGNIPYNERTSVILTTHSMEECEALCPRIGIMANGRLRCLGSAQHLKNKFGQGYQVEMKVNIIDKSDDDYVAILRKLVETKGFPIGDPEEASLPPVEVFFDLDEAKAALEQLTGDDFLSAMIDDSNPSGYGVWKDASSQNGVAAETLAAFAAIELRVRKVAAFFEENYANHVLRERQDTKVRYEVASEGVKISGIFELIEAKKNELRLSDYGVSQTSLEQVFNMHAAEAERLKQGRNDG